MPPIQSRNLFDGYLEEFVVAFGGFACGVDPVRQQGVLDIAVDAGKPMHLQ